MNNKDWVYFKLATGAFEDILDHFVANILAKAAESVNAEKWHFIRYYDETDGLHIRFRVLVNSSVRSDTVHMLSTLFKKEYLKLNSLPPSNYQRMVSMSEFSYDVKVLRVREVTYERELDKFGGPDGIEAAEDWFEASSRIAVEVVRLENKGLLSRKTIAPLLMATVIDALVASPQEFLENYCLGWLPGDPGVARGLREEFFYKAGELADNGISIISASATWDRDTTALIEQWQRAIITARTSFARQKNTDVYYQIHQAWQMIHLMNNRLGFSPLEEAYLATLVEAHYSLANSYAA
jgi:thiopeptide-type bacteriocin biosynthesis protein